MNLILFNFCPAYNTESNKIEKFMKFVPLGIMKYLLLYLIKLTFSFK